MSQEGVAAVDRALSILDAFSDGDDALSLADLAKRTGLYKSTLLRLAASLEKSQYLRRLKDGRYRLGPALLRLGSLYQHSFDLGDYTLPILRTLAEETGESASLYVREGDKRLCLYRVHSSHHRVLHYVTPGTQLPLETGASGRVIMAFSEGGGKLEDALVISAQQRNTDTTAIACPVFGISGFVGALSLAGPKTRFSDSIILNLGVTLLNAALSLSETLGGDREMLRRKLEEQRGGLEGASMEVD